MSRSLKSQNKTKNKLSYAQNIYVKKNHQNQASYNLEETTEVNLFKALIVETGKIRPRRTK